MQRNRRSRVKPQDKYQKNEKIQANEVRVVTESNEMLGVMKLSAALVIKEERNLDLVSISPGTVPPICKLIDYGKFLYQQDKKRKEVKKNQKIVLLKEIKMRPKTDVHDYDFKIKHAKEFLNQGNKVKITIKFKGREMAYINIGKERIDKIIEDTKDVARVEIYPKMEGRNLQMILGPKAPQQTKSTKKNLTKKTNIPKSNENKQIKPDISSLNNIKIKTKNNSTEKN